MKLSEDGAADGEAMPVKVMKYRLNGNGMVDAPSIDLNICQGTLKWGCSRNCEHSQTSVC